MRANLITLTLLRLFIWTHLHSYSRTILVESEYECEGETKSEGVYNGRKSRYNIKTLGNREEECRIKADI